MPSPAGDERDACRAVWTRRRFLALLAGGAAGLLLQACGRDRIAPTATPTKTPTLAALRTGTPTPSAAPPQATPTNTGTPTPEPSATPTPEPVATPTPTATPFPPGPPSKLGVFMGYNHPQLFDLLRTGNVALVKTLEYDPNFVADIKQLSPATVIVARLDPLPTPDLANWNPQEAARQFVDALLPIASEPRRQANIDAWESFNEPTPSDADQMARLATFEAERTRLLAAAGIRSCVGNFSTGQPALELWPAFFPALQAIQEHNGYLGLHEYSAPTLWFGSGQHQLQAGQNEGDEGWLTLRYRKVYRDYLQPAGLEVPLLLTEIGVDGLVSGRPGSPGGGWMDFVDDWRAEGLVSTTGAGFYIEQLAWYDGELARDSYVKGAAIFTLAGPDGWQSYEIHGEAGDILRQYLAVHPPR